jgi:hypothetical protein
MSRRGSYDSRPAGATPISARGRSRKRMYESGAEDSTSGADASPIKPTARYPNGIEGGMQYPPIVPRPVGLPPTNQAQHTSSHSPELDTIHHRRNRRNLQSRVRAEKRRERIAMIQSKPENERSQEEKQELAEHMLKKQRKNENARERDQQRKSEIERIHSKPEHERTEEEVEFLKKCEERKQRRNLADAKRRLKKKTTTDAAANKVTIAAAPVKAAVPIKSLVKAAAPKDCAIEAPAPEKCTASLNPKKATKTAATPPLSAMPPKMRHKARKFFPIRSTGENSGQSSDTSTDLDPNQLETQQPLPLPTSQDLRGQPARTGDLSCTIYVPPAPHGNSPRPPQPSPTDTSSDPYHPKKWQPSPLLAHRDLAGQSNTKGDSSSGAYPPATDGYSPQPHQRSYPQISIQNKVEPNRRDGDDAPSPLDSAFSVDRSSSLLLHAQKQYQQLCRQWQVDPMNKGPEPIDAQAHGKRKRHEEPRIPTPDYELLEKEAIRKKRKAEQNRERAALAREQAAIIRSKPEDEWTEEERLFVEKIDHSRRKKNIRRRERVLERKLEMERIQAIPEYNRSKEEREWLENVVKAKKRKNLVDRLRRDRVKAAALETTSNDEGSDRSELSESPTNATKTATEVELENTSEEWAARPQSAEEDTKEEEEDDYTLVPESYGE